MKVNYVEGDLIKLAKAGMFDVIAHGCNCFCRMKRGIAPQMAEAFNCDRYSLEDEKYQGDINKLGQIEYNTYHITQFSEDKLVSHIEFEVVNCYTQYEWSTETKPFDYQAFTLCMRKMNKVFKDKLIGLPKIGSHLAGGDWDQIVAIIEQELQDCTVIVVEYKPE